MTRFFIVRHGHTKGTENHRYYGRTDMPLSISGIKQIKKIKLDIDYIYSSPSKRCIQTANILRGRKPIEISRDISEIDFGDWEGLTMPQMMKRNPRKFNDWLCDFTPLHPAPLEKLFLTGRGVTGFTNFKMPGGESVKNMIRRVHRFWKYVVNKHKKGNILIVTHGGPAKVIIMRALGLPMKNFWHLHISTGSVSVIEDGVVKAINLWGRLH